MTDEQIKKQIKILGKSNQKLDLVATCLSILFLLFWCYCFIIGFKGLQSFALIFFGTVYYFALKKIEKQKSSNWCAMESLDEMLTNLD